MEPPCKKAKVEPPISEAMMQMAEECKAYIDKAPTPFHLCKESIKLLKQKGFTELSEQAPWNKANLVEPGGRYYYTRNMSTLVAFTVGKTFEAGGRFKIIGAHTDSPVLKLKPVTKRDASGYMQINVECYGGGLWHTWFDRSLTLAGCVIVEEKGGLSKRLVHLQDTLLHIPTLCIHLQSADERASFAPNKEQHLQPIVAMVREQANKTTALNGDAEKGDPRHAPELLLTLAKALKCEPKAIKDFDLTLCDTQGASIWGVNKEFFSSPRIDNQVHCFTGLKALLDYSDDSANDAEVSMLVCFDHEEVGSESAHGAGSPVVMDAIQRVTGCFSKGDEELYKVAIRKSFLFSADGAHAVHPNYAAKHEPKHSPLLNKGTVLKTNGNQRYATNAETGFYFRELARRAGVETQEFVVKNDCPCGSTIGPIISSKTGLRTVDLGVPQLSMHSIRETMGVADIMSNYLLFKTFYKDFVTLDEGMKCVWD